MPIHLYGEPAGRLPFAATEHGLLPPEQLNTLYNRCIAGLVLSATNVSLVPHEMLAAGCIPVVNDAEHNRIVLDNYRSGLRGGDPVRARRRAVASWSSARPPSASRRRRAQPRASTTSPGSRPARRSRRSSAASSTPETGAPPAQLASARRVGPTAVSLPTVSVIVPCYSYGAVLEGCVESVLSQRGVDVRVLIIDDCSPDDSARSPCG